MTILMLGKGLRIVLLLALAVLALRPMTGLPSGILILGNGKTITRAQNPLQFWFAIFLSASISLVLALWAFGGF